MSDHVVHYTLGTVVHCVVNSVAVGHSCVVNGVVFTHSSTLCSEQCSCWTR